MEVTLKSHEGKWRKWCFNKCSTLNMQRAQKRKLQDSLVEGSEALSLALFSGREEVAKDSQQTYFSFDESGDNLQREASLTLDSKVGAAATKLRDRKLLTKLVAGDIPVIDSYYQEEFYCPFQTIKKYFT